jgi:DNA-binding transcriptional ArsR family regulator
MSVRISINGGYLYLTPSELRNIINCVKLLENAQTRDRRLHADAFSIALKLDKRTRTQALLILMSAGIIMPEQYGRMRLYSLVKGYKEKLRSKTRELSKQG